MTGFDSMKAEILDVRERMRQMIESAPEEKRGRLYDECALFYIAALDEMLKVREPDPKLNSILKLSNNLERYRNKKNAFRYMQDIQPTNPDPEMAFSDNVYLGLGYAQARILRILDDACDCLGGYL